MYFKQIEAAVHIAMLRNTVGGDKLSAEMVMLLVMMVDEGYLLFPSSDERAAFDLTWLPGLKND
jgi:hypothetical protein